MIALFTTVSGEPGPGQGQPVMFLAPPGFTFEGRYGD